ncbi:F-box/WD repeat-containing protein 11 [Eurytemora carolleeae]|uniref:F-box/WD repeat-containing protein 11 n=1 Tax=Eurytemora carolleeae TaxID=1294199 RepID=UPI000C7685A1|nr:F-box/WD repeat-containing protein 11 [Eurytemora carolleeae]|eukprot:XP_023348186.1 F-box/WD repeat-containing protein 11-like [Eurytemora affinis]
MGPLADWEKRMDILNALASHGLHHLLEAIFHNLESADLRSIRLVSTCWFGLVEQLIHHGELSYLSRRWDDGEPKVGEMQCKKERSVCTVTSLAVDDTSIAAGLGSSGKIEVWNRRSFDKILEIEGHKEGVYTLQFGRFILVSGGEDGKVRVWSRSSGDLLDVLDHHTYIVWSVKLEGDQLVTASYDCTVCFLSIQGSENSFQSTLKKKIQGPWEWADALFLEDHGYLLVVHDETNFSLQVWGIENQEKISRLEGHTDEVHAVEVKGALLVSGGSDKSVRVWNWKRSVCLYILEGHEGKVWSIGIHRMRIGSGGRFGEVKVWNIPNLEEMINQKFENPASDEVIGDEEVTQSPTLIKKSRTLLCHPKSTSVSVLHIDSFCLVTGDGLAKIINWDFWHQQSNSSSCKKYNTPVPDPLLMERHLR